MKKINSEIIKLLMFIAAAGIFFSCATAVVLPEMTEAEKAVILISGFDDKASIEIKRLNESCKPVGSLEYINEAFVENPEGSRLTRGRAVALKADTAHYYYYDDVRGASIVRFWKCK